MCLFDLDAIRLASGNENYEQIVNELKLKFRETLFTGETNKDGSPVYNDFISLYGRLVTLIDAAEQFIRENKQNIHNEVYRLYPDEASKGQQFAHNGGKFVLRTQEIYNYLDYDVPVVVKAKNGRAIRRRVLRQLYSRRDSLKASLAELGKDIKRHESLILSTNANKMQPTEIRQNLAYI